MSDNGAGAKSGSSEPAHVTVRHSGRESDPMLAELVGRGGRVRELVKQMDSEHVAQHMQSSLVGAAATHSHSYSFTAAASASTRRTGPGPSTGPSPSSTSEVAIGERVQNARRAADTEKAKLTASSTSESSLENAGELAAAAVAAAVEEAITAASEPSEPQDEAVDAYRTRSTSGSTDGIQVAPAPVPATATTSTAGSRTARPDDPLAQFSDKTLEEKKKALAMLKQIFLSKVSINHNDPENENADVKPAGADENQMVASGATGEVKEASAAGEDVQTDAVTDGVDAGQVTDATGAEKPPE